jgi:carboxypeptidase Q
MTTSAEASRSAYLCGRSGVPGASLKNENERYFYFHHSNGDQMAVFQPSELDLAAAVFAVTAYVVADLDDLLPR